MLCVKSSLLHSEQAPLFFFGEFSRACVGGPTFHNCFIAKSQISKLSGESPPPFAFETEPYLRLNNRQVRQCRVLQYCVPVPLVPVQYSGRSTSGGASGVPWSTSLAQC